MRRLILAAGLSLAAALSGCAAPRCVGSGGQSEGTCPPTAASAGNFLSERPKTLLPDLSGLPASALPDQRMEALAAAGQYRAFQPMEAQCRAVEICPLANALAAESAWIACSSKHRKDQQSNQLKAQVLAFRAAEERNKAAGKAMECFYLLVEAETSRDLLRRSKEKTAAMLDDVSRLQKQGMRVDKGLAELRRQWPEALDREAQARLAIEQLNSNLRQLLGLCPENSEPIWPVIDWRVTAEPLDEQAAICEGLGHRADLGLLSMLAQSVDDDNLDGARSGLSAITGMPTSPVAECLFHLHGSGESDTRRSQFNQLLANRQQAATEEIRLAVRTVEIRLQQIAIAKMKLDVCQEQLDSLRLRRERPDSGVTVLDLGAVELQLLERQSDLLHQAVAWRVAQAKLKEAQGLLAFECGMGCAP